MPARRVLSVGQCDPDDAGIAAMLEAHFEVEMDRVMYPDEAVAALARSKYDLVLVNRLIFDDRGPGMELIHRMKADATVRSIPVMLVSNFAKAQAEAVAAGAAPGFGKDELDEPATVEKLKPFLSLPPHAGRGDRETRGRGDK
jgi:DNA-binding NarL/FixJ family response regulator